MTRDYIPRRGFGGIKGTQVPFAGHKIGHPWIIDSIVRYSDNSRVFTQWQFQLEYGIERGLDTMTWRKVADWVSPIAASV